MNHEKLDCYQVSLRLLQEVGQAARRWPRGSGFLTNQLHRALSSILLNISEGNARFGQAERRNFFQIARASAAECAACLDVALALAYIRTSHIEQWKGLLHRIMCMLRAMR